MADSSRMSDAILLDTHAAIWFMTGTLRQNACELLADAAIETGIYISPIIAWEVGQLTNSEVKSAVVGLSINATEWLASLLRNRGFRECVFDARIALASTALPGNFHRDPADRFLVATARALDCALMTRDRKILAYADQGHVKAIPC